MAVKRHPCIFKDPMIHNEVNPRLAKINPKAPYGAFQRLWRQLHCQTLNHWSSEDCPYRPEECVVAYWKTATDALNAETSPIGLFRILARRRAYDRAENKPLERDRDEAVGRGRGREAGQTVHGPGSGPVRIGELLREMDVRARDRPQPEGEESAG